jgi:hypothetical protein
MSKDILSEYGKDSGAGQKARAECGGVREVKELPYKTPVGPTQQMRRQPGLGGTVHDCGSQGKH